MDIPELAIPKPSSGVFRYGSESVIGLIPYILTTGSAGRRVQWMIVFTHNAIYFVFCGFDNSLVPGLKAKQLTASTQGKSLEELLKMGQDFYRVDANQINKLNHKKGWFNAKIWFKNSENIDVKIHLAKKDYAKFLQFLALIQPQRASMPADSSQEITRESLGAQIVLQPLTEEEIKQEKRRTRAIAWVLLINSIVSGGFMIWLYSKGVVDENMARSIGPLIIDISIAIALFTSGKKDLLKFVLFRSVLGAIWWIGSLAHQEDWITLVIQIPYFSYLIYHSQVKATEKTFRIAMRILAVAIVVFIAGTAYGFNTGKDTIKKYDSRLIAVSSQIDKNLVEQEDLVFAAIEDATDDEIIQKRKDILEISYDQKKKIEAIMPIINEGLKEFTDTGSQKNLKGLKTLYEIEAAQNQAVIDLYEFIETLDEQNITEEQAEIYSQKEQAVYDAYEKVRKQGESMLE